ncbi:type II and III secretion system protein family protein [uncultured Thiodictyon sp.]|uniref:type II and III secretion system protein family protein n=1 Tax=uncultured Thiodictyon sp. TaxID=1846217 RepID=UPI0025E7BF3A|nr:type II and III secretion system protein family protein [uncultured Thiodictyon sp.]
MKHANTPPPIRVEPTGAPPVRWTWAVSLAAGFCLLLLLQALLPAAAQARPAASDAAAAREQVTVALSQSRVIKLRSRAARVSVADPEIADILVLDPGQIYVVGKKLGTTNLILWDAKDRISGSITLEVTPDLEQLKARLHDVLPRERVEVRSAQGAIVVSGVVSSPEKAAAAIQLAESFAGTAGLKPLNMMQVGGAQQVLLEVKIAEISRTLSKRLDMHLNGFYNGGQIKMGTLDAGAYTFPATTFPATTATVTSGAGLNASTTSTFAGTGGAGTVSTTSIPSNYQTSAITSTNTGSATLDPRLGVGVPGYAAQSAVTLLGKGMFSQFLAGNFLLNMYIDAAKDSGLARILAEPNLTTLSGQEAKFLAGGQYPYTVAQPTQGAVLYTTEFKDYGVGLQFVPVVLDSGVISLKVSISVSQLDFSYATANNPNPGLKTRSANATVEVKTGQTISIAGLIDEKMRDNVDKFPVLGEIPVLGMLFRSQSFQKDQTELVIFVTPRLARSFDQKQVKLPTDNFVEPNDLEFYLMGRTQGRTPRSGAAAPNEGIGPDRSGSEGAFGHDL